MKNNTPVIGSIIPINPADRKVLMPRKFKQPEVESRLAKRNKFIHGVFNAISNLISIAIIVAVVVVVYSFFF